MEKLSTIARLLVLAALLSLAGSPAPAQVVKGGGTAESETQTLATCSGTLTFLDALGTQSDQFELVITGTPATVTVTINGLLPGGTVTPLATSTSTTSNVVSTAGGPFTKYTVVSACTGGASPAITVNRLASAARRAPTTLITLPDPRYPIVGGDAATAFSAACGALSAFGGVVDARTVVTPLWLNSQMFNGCNAKSTILFLPAGAIYTSVGQVIPNSKSMLRGVGSNTTPSCTQGTCLIACYSSGVNGCGANPSGFPDMTPNTIQVNGPFLPDTKAFAGTCAGSGGAVFPCNASPVVIYGGNANTGKTNCNADTFGGGIFDISIDANQVPNSIAIYGCTTEEMSLIAYVHVNHFSLGGIVLDNTNMTSSENVSHWSGRGFYIQSQGASITEKATIPIGGLVRTAGNIVTVTETGSTAHVPYPREPVAITAASDASFAGNYIVCTPADNAGCVTPTVSTFSYLQNAGGAGTSVGTASGQFATYGIIEEHTTKGGGPNECCFATITGDQAGQGGFQLPLYNGLWTSGGTSGVYNAIHFENVIQDAALFGQNEATSGIQTNGLNMGGSLSPAVGAAVIRYTTNTLASTAINTTTSFTSKLLINDQHNGYSLLGSQAEAGTIGFYSQGIQGTPACYATGASPLACNAAVSGIVSIAVGAASVTVNTSQVTAQSVITLGNNTAATSATKIGAASCTPTALQAAQVSAVVAATSFTILVPANVAGNPQCVNFAIAN